MPTDPETVGPYRLLERIGEGGMGTVYAAEQITPIRRRVALKVIKPGMDTREVIARFEAERQVLALMNHPNIAAILDAGATSTGGPYFVMEYVAGEPVTDFCDKHRMELRGRIELFTSICDGVLHAHQKGIIHRDLKPSNVLVTIEGEQAVPKVIDFGVAKATQQPLTGATLHTKVGMVIGTPEYMSPEQAEMSGLDIDTRSDVYSLGMMLYELLVGELPLDLRSLRGQPDQIRKHIREAPLRRPSSNVVVGDDSGWEPSRQRQLEPLAHRRMLRGDLDAIVMKALDKNRTRRYESAAELAADLRRHLRGQAVMAGPDSVAYRAKKFISRHRTSVAVTMGAALLLLLYGITVTVQNRRVERALQQAVMEADRAEQATDFLVRLLESDIPGGDTTVQYVLSQGVRDAATLNGQPAVQAQVVTVLARIYRHLGDFRTAHHILGEAVKIERALQDAGDPIGADARIGLGDVLRLLERYDSSEVVLRDALASERTFMGGDHPRIARALTELHLTLRDAGNLAAAEELIREALAMNQRLFTGDHPDLAGSLNYLAALLRRQVHLEEAEPLYQEALDMRRRLFAEGHTSIAESLNNLALLSTQTGNHERADSLYGLAVDIYIRLLGEDHPWVASGLMNHAQVASRLGRPEEARTMVRRSLEIRRKVFGEQSGAVARSLSWLGVFYRATGPVDSAVFFGRQAVAAAEAAFGENINTADHIATLGGSLLISDDFDDAAQVLDRSIAMYRELGGHNTIMATALFNRGRVFAHMGALTRAADFMSEAFAMRRGFFGDAAPVVIRTADSLATVYHALGRPAAADSVRSVLARPRD
jgi:non-specific serine/threonine protein kinase/serine/threonine-protein kinase